jgi:hypothetical protein
LFSAPAISSGQTYTIYTGATVSGADENGYAVSTSFSGGTKLASVTLSKNIMSYGSSGNSFH